MFGKELLQQLKEDTRRVKDRLSVTNRIAAIVGGFSLAEVKDIDSHIDNVAEILNDYPGPKIVNRLYNSLSVLVAEQQKHLQTVERYTSEVYKDPTEGREFIRNKKRSNLVFRTRCLIASNRNAGGSRQK